MRPVYSEGGKNRKLKMVEKDGEMVPFFLAKYGGKYYMNGGVAPGGMSTLGALGGILGLANQGVNLYKNMQSIGFDPLNLQKNQPQEMQDPQKNVYRYGGKRKGGGGDEPATIDGGDDTFFNGGRGPRVGSATNPYVRPERVDKTIRQTYGSSIAPNRIVETHTSGQAGDREVYRPGFMPGLGIPTGRSYSDVLNQMVRDYYVNNALAGQVETMKHTVQDDFANTYNRYKRNVAEGPSRMTRKTVEMGGEDLNFMQRLLPQLMRRYKTSTEYQNGEKVREVIREGGRRSVKTYPTQEELRMMFEADRASLDNAQ